MAKFKSFGLRIRGVAFVLAVISATIFAVYFLAYAANTTIGNNITTSGTLTVGGLAKFSGQINASSTVLVDGLSTLTGFISTASSTVAGPLHVSGVLRASSTLAIGDNALIVDASNRVGISTTSPARLLSVQGNALFSGDLSLANLIATGTITVSGTASSSFTILGVGTTSPWGRFSVEMDGTNPAFVVSNNGSTTPSLFIGGVDQNGYVGIGTQNPTDALTVNGNISNLATSTNIFNPVLKGTAGIGNYGSYVYVSGRYAYVTTETAGTLRIFDVSTSTPALVSSVSAGDRPGVVYVTGRYAYIQNVAPGGLRIFDISNPSNPSQISFVPTQKDGYGFIHIQGNRAYIVQNVTGGDSAFQIFDISNPFNPARLSITKHIAPQFIYVSGKYAYISNVSSETLQIYDVSTSTPSLVGSVSTGADPAEIYVSGKFAYLGTYAGKTFEIYDISNPASPVQLSSISTGASSGPWGLDVIGRFAYLTFYDSNQLRVYDVFNPRGPVAVGTVSTAAAPVSVKVSGRYAYVVGQSGASDQLEIFDISGLETTSANIHSLEAGQLQVRNNIWTQGYLAAGGVSVGFGGILSNGPLAVTATASPSSFLGGLFIGTSTPATTSPNYSVFMQSTAVIEATSSGSVPLTLRGAGTQTANLLQVQNSADVNLFFLNSVGGFVSAGASSTISGSLNVIGPLSASSTLSVANLASLDSGFISSASSTVAGSLQVAGVLQASSTLTVASLANLYGGFIGVGSSTVTGPLTVTSALSASSTLSVNNLSTLVGGFISSASSTVAGPLHVVNVLRGSSTLSITGISTLADLANLQGGFISSASSSVSSLLNVQGPISASSTLIVNGQSTLTGGFISSASSTVAGTFHIAGNLRASSTVSLATTTLTVNFASGTPDLPEAGIPLTLANTQSATDTAVRLAFQIQDSLNVATTTAALNSALTQNYESGTSFLSFLTLNAGRLSEAARFTSLGGLIVKGSTTISNQFNVIGALSASSTLSVANLASLDSGFISSASSTVAGPLHVSGVLRASSTMTVAGLARFDSGFISSASSTVGNSLNISGPLLASSTLNVTGLSALTGFISSASSTITGSLQVAGVLNASSTLTVASLANLYGGFIGVGSSTVTGPLTVTSALSASSSLSVLNLSTLYGGFISSGSSSVSSLLNVQGPLSASSTLIVNGQANFSGSVGIGTSTPARLLSVQGDVLFSGDLQLAGLRATGSIAIGSSTPYAKLVIQAEPRNTTRLVSVASSSNDVYFEISSTGTTTIEQLQTGVQTFDTNAGAVTWVDMPITAGVAFDTVMSYHAMLDASSTLTVYGRSDGVGGVTNQRVGIGTTSPWAMFSVEKTTASNTVPVFVVSTAATATPYLIVANNGYVGIGTSSPGFPLSVFGNIGVMSCIRSATSSSQNTIFGPGDCVAQDIAESYIAGETVEPGDIVALNESAPIRLVKAVKTSKLILGAISSRPAILFEGSLSSFGAPDVQNSYAPGEKAPLALSGRIFVKVGLEGGEIKAGDPITASSESGIGAKATISGTIIGYALEDFSGPTEQNQGMVAMIISLGHWQTPPSEEGDGLLAQVIDLVKQWLESMKVFIEDGLVKLKELIAEKITVKHLCVDDACIDSDQFKALLNNAGISPQPPQEEPPS